MAAHQTHGQLLCMLSFAFLTCMAFPMQELSAFSRPPITSNCTKFLSLANSQASSHVSSLACNVLSAAQLSPWVYDLSCTSSQGVKSSPNLEITPASISSYIQRLSQAHFPHILSASFLSSFVGDQQMAQFPFSARHASFFPAFVSSHTQQSLPSCPLLSESMPRPLTASLEPHTKGGSSVCSSYIPLSP